jgi:enoyl-CoA hydratase/carnithine racemase
VSTKSSQQANDPVLLRVEGAIARVSFNEPASRNAMTDERRAAFAAALKVVGKNEEVRVVIIRGEGTAFSSGGDLRPGVAKINLAQENPYAYLKYELEEEQQIQTSIFKLDDKIVIAALNGPAIGQGFEIAMFTDYRISVASARFQLPQVVMGVIPPFAMGPLQHFIPPSVAMRLILLGEYFDATEAKNLGLIDQIVPDAEFDDAVRDLAARFAEVPVGVVQVVKNWFKRPIINGASEAQGAMHYAQFFLRNFKTAKDARNTLRERVLRRSNLPQ